MDAERAQPRASLNALPGSESDHLLPRPRSVIGQVYLKKPSMTWVPDAVLGCCFEIAEVKNANLVRGMVVPDTDLFMTAASYGTTSPINGGAFSILRLFVLCIATVASGAANNVTFVLMGNAMPAYPAFLLYFSTVLYSILYGVWLVHRKWTLGKAAKAAGATPGPMYRGSQRSIVYYYTVTVVLLTINGVLSQFADTHVNGSLQALINQGTLPMTAICARLYLNHRFSNMEILGAIIVFLGSMLPVLPPLIWDRSKTNAASGSDMDTPFWVIMFLLSDLPSALGNVVQEKILTPEHGVAADEIHYLTWTNIWTIPTYALSSLFALVPMFGTGSTLSQVWMQQVDAFKCFAGVHPLPPGCMEHAWWPVVNFVIWFAIYFYMIAVVTSKESAAFQVIVNTLVTPVSAVAFSFPWLVGSAASTQLDQFMIVGIVLIPVGILVYKGDELLNGTRAIVPLIARH